MLLSEIYKKLQILPIFWMQRVARDHAGKRMIGGEHAKRQGEG